MDGELGSLLALVRDMHSRLPVIEIALAEAPVALHGQNRQRRRAVGVEDNVTLAVLGVFTPLRNVSVTAPAQQ